MDRFCTLLDQYKQIAFPNLDQDDSSLASTFELFQTIDHVKLVPDQQVIDLLVAGCKVLNHEHNQARSFCQFMYKQLSKQIRVTNFRPAQFDICIKYLLDSLDTTDDNEHKTDLLRSLSALVYENTTHTQRSLSRFSKTLQTLADKSTKPLQVRRMAINCIGNACATTTITNPTSSSSNSNQKLFQPSSVYQDFYACLLGNVCEVSRTSQGTVMVTSNSLDLTDTAVRKVASSTLRSLQFLLCCDKSLVTNPLCDIIEIIHLFVFMDVSVQTYSSSSSLQQQQQYTLGGTAAGRRVNNRLLHHQHPAMSALSWRSVSSIAYSPKHSMVTSSESEQSDSSSIVDTVSPRRQRDYAKIRINALLCISAIANTSPKALYPYWSKFLPSTFSIFLSNNHSQEDTSVLSGIMRSDSQPHSLFTILLYDTMVTVRSAVCNTLVSILNGSKQYLSLAFESEKASKTAFTSLSESMGAIIRDIHQGLVHVLRKETSIQVLTVTMQVASSLVENCTYERLDKKHLPLLYFAIKKHWKEPALRSSVLKVFISIFSVHQDNLKELVQTDLIDTVLLDVFQNDNNSSTVTEEETGTVKEEAWMLSMALTKHHFDNSTPYYLWHKLMTYIPISTTTTTTVSTITPTTAVGVATIAASLKWIETYTAAITESDTQESVDWWKTVLESYLQEASSHNASVVRAAACDCFASVSKTLFEKLHYRYQRLAISLLFSLASDTDSHVTAAACRALGVFILFPSLHEDAMFVSDMVKSTFSLLQQDKTMLVKVRTSWAMANLCDALVLQASAESDGFSLREYMSPEEWINVLSTATSHAMDNEKLRSNAVRAIGSLLRVTPSAYYENARMMALVREAVEKGLMKNIEGGGSLKTRWNACHATGNMLLNRHFPIGYCKGGTGAGGMYPWTGHLFAALTQALLKCKNFKVRINACLAVTAPLQQEQYGDRLSVVVASIIEAWEMCRQNSQDYKEIKYKQQLEQQIKDSLDHLKDWIPAEYKDQVLKILQDA